MNTLSVSLIVSAYNEENYIGACLESATQSGTNHFAEILVIDNASTDRTAEVAAAYPGVRVVREDKKGVTRARQRGLQEAKGNLLAFVDADTRIPDGWYEQIIREFKANPGLACLSGPYVYYDFSPWQSFLASFYWNAIAIPTAWVVGYMAIAGNMVLPRIVLEQMGGFDTSIEFYGDDTDTARRAKAFGKVRFTSRFFMYSSSRRFLNQGLFKTVYIYIFAFLSEAILHRPPSNAHEDFR